MKLLTNLLFSYFLMNNINNNNFLNELPKNLRKQYRQEEANVIKKINIKWSDNLHRERRLNDIKDSEHHAAIINACIYPFVQEDSLSSNLDYSYIQNSPLWETGDKNFDFLLGSTTDKILIFGEAKGKVTPKNIIHQYRERKQIIKKHSKLIKENIFDTDKYEYVLGVPSYEVDKMQTAIKKSKEDIIVWGINEGESILSLDTLQENIHYNDNLNKILKTIPTNTNYKEFFYENQTFAKMNLLTAIDKNNKEMWFFSFDDLKQMVTTELDHTSEKTIINCTNYILTNATQIGFIKNLKNEQYKIQSRYKDSGQRSNELKEKYITYCINKRRNEEITDERKKIQDVFLSKITTLFD